MNRIEMEEIQVAVDQAVVARTEAAARPEGFEIWIYGVAEIQAALEMKLPSGKVL